MSEINNSHINNYGFNTPHIGIKKDDSSKQEPAKEEVQAEQKYAHDTGVLGRSQIHRMRGGNIEKSVDEAVYMAENCPVRTKCSEMIFDNFYQKYLDSGIDEADAYLKALLGEEEFLNLSEAYKK